MRLNGVAVRISMFWHQQDLIRAQSKLIRLLKEQRNQTQLDHTKELQELITLWLLCLEQPEIDMRDTLADMEQALRERAAVLEEHIL